MDHLLLHILTAVAHVKAVLDLKGMEGPIQCLLAEEAELSSSS